MIGRLVAALIISYILFLLPYLLSALMIMIFSTILVLIVLLAAIISAMVSGFLLRGSYSIIPPLAGSVASLLTNHFSGELWAISSQVYLEWPYWTLSFLASPLLAILVASLKAEEEAEREARTVMTVGPETEVAEEEMGLIECPTCSGQIPSDSIYCPLCGSRVAEEG